MTTPTYEPALTVPEDMLAFLRTHAPRNAFFASMLAAVRKNGGLTARQMELVKADTGPRNY